MKKIILHILPFILGIGCILPFIKNGGEDLYLLILGSLCLFIGVVGLVTAGIIKLIKSLDSK